MNDSLNDSPVALAPLAPEASPQMAVLVANGNGAAEDWPSDWVQRLVLVWAPHGAIAHPKLGKLLRPLKGQYPFGDVERGLAAYLAAGNGRYGAAKFAETVGEWVGAAAELTPTTRATLAACAAFARGDRS